MSISVTALNEKKIGEECEISHHLYEMEPCRVRNRLIVRDRTRSDPH